MCRSACPAASARPSKYAAKRLCCGPGEERRDPTKQFYIKLFVFNTVILASCENNEAVRRNRNSCRISQPVQRWSGCVNSTAVACCRRVHPVIVNVAVKDLGPVS